MNSQLVLRETEKTLVPIFKALEVDWTSEKQVSDNTTGRLDSTGTLDLYEIEFSVSKKFLRKLSLRQISLIVEILSLSDNRPEWISLLWEALAQEATRRDKYCLEGNFLSRETYTRRRLLALDAIHHRGLNTYFGQLLGSWNLRNGEKLSLLEVLRKLLPRFRSYSKQRPIKVERHRGYRDHGSLGPDLPNAYINDTKSFTEIHNLKEESESLHQFFLGFTE